MLAAIQLLLEDSSPPPPPTPTAKDPGGGSVVPEYRTSDATVVQAADETVTVTVEYEILEEP